MKNDDLFTAKCEFLKERYIELQNHLVALERSPKNSEPFPEPLAKQLHSDELKGFSQLLEALNNHVDGKEGSRRGLFEKQVNLLMSNSTPDIELLRHPLIDPEYTFSDEWIDADEGIGFKAELFAVMWFFLKSEGADPQVDFALTKVLFQLGKIIERLKQDGRRKKDQTSIAGSTQHKEKITHEEVIQTAKDVVEKLKGLGIKPTMRSVASNVEKRLFKSEREKENPKELYGYENIRKIIKEVWSEIL